MPLVAGARTSDRITRFDPDHVLVMFDDASGPDLRAAVHAIVGASVVNQMPWLDLDVVRLPAGVSAPVAVERYAALPGVRSAVLNRTVRAQGVPNDTLFSDQWGFHNVGQRVTGSLVTGRTDVDIDAPEAWTEAFGSATFESTGGSRVAVLDTGIDRTHVDLLDKVVACASATSGVGLVVSGSCSDDNLHGTHTAGTVAANTNNGIGVAGTAPNAELAIFKFLNAGGVGFLADEIAGIRWAHETARADIISMSFSSYEEDTAERSAVRDANNAGLLLIAAAGNDYDDTKNYPAYYSEVMSVTSNNAADVISGFANCNTDVEISAPGEDIWSTFPGNGYGVISGTSMSTPHVAGIAALLMSEKGLSAQQARNVIVNTAEPVASTGGRDECNGIRRANLAAALGTSGGTEPPPPPDPGAIAGTVTQGGKVKDPIAGASVDCGSGGTATTASDGTYRLDPVPSGSYTCTAAASSFQPKSQNVSVYSGTTTTADFALRAAKGGSQAKRN
jgi:thermitase